ncbi:MAG: ABC transporter permease [Deltaproteobacteria bacterium]|nr:ABC transporter permease [Deltaproteobacteria bacterium]
MNNFLKITGYTIRDQMRHKSFYVLLGLSILFVLMIRGCYSGQYAVNGKQLNNITVAWHVSKIVFQVIASGMSLIVILLSMKIFSRDHEDGSLVLFLSRPLFRRQYILGRIAGTWFLCLAFMFILHATIFLTVWVKTGAAIPGYLTASLVCSINLLFIAVSVSFLSLYLPDFISAVFTVGILFVGYISDGGHQILNSEILKTAVSSAAASPPALWRILYPKVYMVQAYADSIIGQSSFNNMGLSPNYCIVKIRPRKSAWGLGKGLPRISGTSKNP